MAILIRIVFVMVLSGASFSLSFAQSDWALHSTFTTNRAAVFEVSVEVPREHLMKRLSDSFEQMRTFQTTYADLISGITQAETSMALVERHLNRMETHLSTIRERMVENAPEKGIGFAIDKNHIVTMNTIVQDATLSGSMLQVKDSLNNFYRAEVKGMDPVTGVAVLSVPSATFESWVELSRNVHDLPEASFVMSIQRPYDLPPSPFGGMISGYSRLLKLFEYEDYIQTSLPLYPNNNGAPVFNPSGHFVGMLVYGHQIEYSPQISFVMPADIIEDAAQAIIEHGKRERGYLAGMEIGPHPYGVHVKTVFPETPAAKAGLQPNDLIVGFNGQREQNVLDFYHRILDTYPEETVILEVIRGNQRIQIQAKTTAKL